MDLKKIVTEKLADAELFRAHRIRQMTVNEFLEEFKNPELILPGPKEELHAILVTFMEWLDEKKKKS